MKLVALQSFGKMEKGDTVEVPDGASYAAGYFAEARDDGEPVVIPPDATPVAEGLSDAPEKQNDEQDEAPAKEEV